MSTIIILTPPPEIRRAVVTALDRLPNAMDSRGARALLYNTGFQESFFKHRRQLITKNGKLVPEGPAKSFWQGERGGGMCAGVLRHNSTRDYMRALCARHGIEPNAKAVWDAIEHDDVLAASCARLLYWTDPKKILEPYDPLSEQAGWEMYLRQWRPGAHTRGNEDERADLRAKWAKHWPLSVAAAYE